MSRNVSYAVMLQISIEDSVMELTEEQVERIRQYIANGSIQEKEWEGKPEMELAIVNFLIQQMSGEFEVSTKTDGGTILTISLPQLEVKGGTAHGV